MNHLPSHLAGSNLKQLQIKGTVDNNAIDLQDRKISHERLRNNNVRWVVY